MRVVVLAVVVIAVTVGTIVGWVAVLVPGTEKNIQFYLAKMKESYVCLWYTQL